MARILVVTGGIGSGKSEVCRILHELGYTAQYNADQRVKSLYEESATLLDSIEASLGIGLKNADGVFQPKKLAGIIFNDAESLEIVESLVFPALIEDFSSYVSRHPEEKIIIFESATILEKPAFDGFGDKTVLVDAPYSIRLERACARNGASREEVEARMAAQKMMNSFSTGGWRSCPRIDAIITNDAGIEELRERTSEVISHLFDN